MNSNFNQQAEKFMTPDQFVQVVDAILEGKYSWACVLILRFAGYNPLHYIPYRTYNRLMKDHSQHHRIRLGACAAERFSGTADASTIPDDAFKSSRIRDLSYLEPIGQAEISGGQRPSSPPCLILSTLNSLFQQR
ncbi:MAG: HetP family heterocyst commitment protein [Elainella sp.]